MPDNNGIRSISRAPYASIKQYPPPPRWKCHICWFLALSLRWLSDKIYIIYKMYFANIVQLWNETLLNLFLTDLLPNSWSKILGLWSRDVTCIEIILYTCNVNHHITIRVLMSKVTCIIQRNNVQSDMYSTTEHCPKWHVFYNGTMSKITCILQRNNVQSEMYSTTEQCPKWHVFYNRTLSKKWHVFYNGTVSKVTCILQSVY